MKSEVLSISTSAIEVDYVFANPGPADVTTVVAFPLPDLNLAEMADSPSSIPFRGSRILWGSGRGWTARRSR